MRSPNGSNHTTQTPPPLSFYNTFKAFLAKHSQSTLHRVFPEQNIYYKGSGWVGKLNR